MLTESEVVSKLSAHIKEKWGKVQAFAEHTGVSPEYVYIVLNGKRRPSKKLLSEIGYKRVAMYTQLNQE